MPVTVPVGEMEVMTGGGPENSLVLPLTSVAVARTLAPVKALPLLKDQVPPVAVVVPSYHCPSSSLSEKTSMVQPEQAVPEAVPAPGSWLLITPLDASYFIRILVYYMLSL